MQKCNRQRTARRALFEDECFWTKMVTRIAFQVQMLLLANSFKEAPLHLVPPVSETVDSLDQARAVAPSRQGSWRSLLRVEERPPLMISWSRDPARRALSLSPARSNSGKCSEQATTNHPTSALRVRAPRLCAKCGWRSQPTGFVHSGSRVPPVGIFDLEKRARPTAQPASSVRRIVHSPP